MVFFFFFEMGDETLTQMSAYLISYFSSSSPNNADDKFLQQLEPSQLKFLFS